MSDTYQIHLNFLPVIGDIPSFTVFRSHRQDLAQPRPKNLDVHGYSLPKLAANTEDRDNYWVSDVKIDGFEEFKVEPGFNNDLTRWMLFRALCANATAKIPADQLWVNDHAFQPEIHFTIRRHDEGEEQLIIQSYRLKAARKFGLIADFHFRKKDGVPFTRKIQQLSLSLDRNYKRNLDFYVDRISRIKAFIKERSGVLSPLMLPGSGKPILLSTEFEPLRAERLRGRVYVFAGEKESRSQFTGLKDFGPLKAVTDKPHLLFVFREQDRHAARSLAIALRGTRQKERYSFPGFESVFRTPVEIDSNPVVIPDFSKEAMLTALERVKQGSGNIVPVLILPQDDETAYLNHKAIFAHAGVATQVCTLEVIQNENTLKWATANIALQIFCKAGGLPWKVRPTSERSLIIGISQSHKLKSELGKRQIEKHFAFSVLTDSSGLFQKIQVLGDADKESDYLAQLRENLRQLLKINAPQFSRVVIHTSFKLKHHEIGQIQKVVEETAASEEGNKTRFAVVKVNHKSRFFGANYSINSLVPFEGSCVKLGYGEYLIWFEGIFPDKPTVTKAFPGPTHIQFLHVKEEKQIEEESLLQELVNLSGANWRGFNAKSAPVSVFYCHLVADMVHDFHDRGLPLPAVEGLQPWFL